MIYVVYLEQVLNYILFHLQLIIYFARFRLISILNHLIFFYLHPNFYLNLRSYHQFITLCLQTFFIHHHLNHHHYSFYLILNLIIIFMIQIKDYQIIFQLLFIIFHHHHHLYIYLKLYNCLLFLHYFYLISHQIKFIKIPTNINHFYFTLVYLFLSNSLNRILN